MTTRPKPAVMSVPDKNTMTNVRITPSGRHITVRIKLIMHDI